jgi:preprotein translocase subunit SecD
MTKIRFTALFIFLIGLGLAYFAGANVFNPNGFLGNVGYRLGLDLKGGSHLVYEADVSGIEKDKISESMAGLRDVLERRINIFGVTEPLVQIQQSGGNQRLVVELAGIFDIGEAIKLIGQTPYLEFKTERPEAEQKAILEAQKSKKMISEDPYFISSALTGRFLKNALLDFNSSTGEPTIILEFNEEGEKIFGDITRENVGKRIAIYLDGMAISAPVVREEIKSGKAQISGRFTPDEARTLVRSFNSGALPVPIRLVSQQNIGASLGEKSFNQGLSAGLYGILAVVLFLILRYRLAGFTAVLSLVFYAVLVLAVFKLLPVTLTAAGIAGFLLSVGMAVDANILIFERMREEAGKGKNIEDSLTEGFQRAWPSIRDSNASTLITSAILYWFGTGVIRGFALTLGIGVLASIFSALIVSKTFLKALGIRRSAFSRLIYGV